MNEFGKIEEKGSPANVSHQIKQKLNEKGKSKPLLCRIGLHGILFLIFKGTTDISWMVCPRCGHILKNYD